MSPQPSASLLAQALGPAWGQLHPTLRAHYASGTVREVGAMDVEFPRWMAPLRRACPGCAALCDGFPFGAPLVWAGIPVRRAVCGAGCV